MTVSPGRLRIQRVNIDHHIAGAPAANTSGRTQDVTNPATGAVTGKV
ncbi:hypothetical protein J2W27_006441, partial [Variovorax boronicumulans]|nr:hypothetical protein [Variovorax boronicumulans]